MLKDLLNTFSEKYKNIGDKLILDSYILKDGLYVKVSKDNTYECFIFKNDKKQEKKENCFTTLKNTIAKNEYDWFKQVDYYSEWLNANKMIFDKKIHNINYLSFFVKVDSFTSTDTKKLLDTNSIKAHFDVFKSYKKFEKKQEVEILEKYKPIFKNEDRLKDIEKKHTFVNKNLNSLVDIAKQNNITNYIKIFFDEDIKTYKQESEIYYSIKIFNEISHSKTLDDDIYGLSDSNMGLNAKKPYLEQKTRKIISPYMILNSDAIMIKKFFDWLKFQDLMNKYPNGEHFFLNRDFREKDVIIDFDYLPQKIDKLKKSIYYKNYLKMTIEKKILDDETIKDIQRLEQIVDEVFYNKQLMHNYFRDDLKVSKFISKNLLTLIFQTKQAMINYFKKYNDKAFYDVISKYATNFVIEHLRHDRFYTAQKSLNLKLSLLHFKGEDIMDIENIKKSIEVKLDNSDFSPLKTDEFFYLCGEIVYYLLSKKEKDDKTHKLIEPFLRANNAQKIKKEIEFCFFQYKHALYFHETKFNNAMSLIMAYENNEKLVHHMDNFLVGYLSNTLIFKTNKEN